MWSKDLTLERLCEEYLQFIKDSKGSTRDHHDFRFGQKMFNFYNDGSIYDGFTDPVYLEDHKVAFDMIYDQIVKQQE